MTAATRAPALRLATAAMGTRFELLIPSREPEAWRAAGEAAIDLIEECHRRYSRFASDSLVSHINRTAADRPVRLDAETFDMLQDALAVQRASGGAFDVAVAADAARAPGITPLLLDPAARTVRFAARDVAIDLGGIAKGHALDRAGALLRGLGVSSALLHGGTSSVLAIGGPAEGAGWKIALGFHRDTEPVELRNAALSVSAASRDHLIDPRNGSRVEQHEAAAVIGPSARLADAWSTALAVLGQRPPELGETWTTVFFDAGDVPRMRACSSMSIEGSTCAAAQETISS